MGGEIPVIRLPANSRSWRNSWSRIGLRRDLTRSAALFGFTGLLLATAGGGAGCAHPARRLFAPMQPDGWSAQPVALSCRFAPDAELEPETGMPVGDAGYYFYILTKSGDWDYGSTMSYLKSHAREPWGHCWLILESPERLMECGLNGNFGRERPKYGDGVSQLFRAKDPNPISYLWVTMSDGEIEYGNGNRTPTFVWRLPITRQRHELIRRHVMQWRFSEIGVRTNNCVDMVTEAAGLADIHLMHRVRLTLPPTIEMMGKTLRIWTDPKYRVLEYSTPDVLEAELRHLARFGIGRDVTAWYLTSDMAAPKRLDRKGGGAGNDARAEDGR